MVRLCSGSLMRYGWSAFMGAYVFTVCFRGSRGCTISVFRVTNESEDHIWTSIKIMITLLSFLIFFLTWNFKGLHFQLSLQFSISTSVCFWYEALNASDICIWNGIRFTNAFSAFSNLERVCRVGASSSHQKALIEIHQFYLYPASSQKNRRTRSLLFENG